MASPGFQFAAEDSPRKMEHREHLFLESSPDERVYPLGPGTCCSPGIARRARDDPIQEISRHGQCYSHVIGRFGRRRRRVAVGNPGQRLPEGAGFRTMRRFSLRIVGAGGIIDIFSCLFDGAKYPEHHA